MARHGLATIMFTDLVSSTRMRERLGDDVADEIGVEHDRIISDALSSTSGRLIKNLGDGALAVFDSSVDAVMAGQRIQEGVAIYNRQAEEARQISVRIGINAGEVAHEDGDVIGLPVAVASRVCDKAEGGQIIITDTVRALIGKRARFPYVSIGLQNLKGVDGEVELWAIEEAAQPTVPDGATDIPFPAFLTRGIPKTLVGRDKQLAKLDAIHAATSSGTSLVTVIGEPGIGKTSLTSTWCKTAADSGATVVAGRCTPDAALPYQPFIEIARTVVNARPGILSEIGPAAGNIAQLVPGMPVPKGLPAPIQTDPDTTLYLMAEAFGALLKPTLGAPATVAVLDDLHWADEASIGVLSHLARKDEDLPLVLIGTYRDTDLVRSHPLPTLLTDLRREHRLERLPLPRLSEEEVGVMIGSYFGSGAASGIIESIADETLGNPFFVEEITTHLRDEGAIDDEGNWVSDIPIGEYGIPEGVRDVVGRRVARLGDEAVRILEAASVIGPTFSIDIAGAIAGLDEQTIDGVVDAAVGARVITESDDSDEFTFAHALLRQTLYDDLPTRRRMRLHLAVGEALEARGESPSIQLYHWLQANENDKALRCALAAATAAEKVFSPTDALTNLNLAYEMWNDVDDPDGVAGITHAQLVLRINETRLDFGVFDQTGFERLNTELEEGDLDSETRALLLNSLAGQYATLGRTKESRDARAQALDLVPKVEPSAAHALILGQTAASLYLDAQSTAAIEMAGEALEIAQLVDDNRSVLTALQTLATALQNVDRMEESERHFGELAKKASETGIVKYQLIGYVNQASGLAQHGLLQQALDIATRGIERTAELGLERWEAMLRGNAASILFDLGRWDESETVLRGAVVSAEVDFPQINLSLATMELAIERGDIATMRAEIERLKEFTISELDRQFQGPYWEVIVSNLRWQGDPSGAYTAGSALLNRTSTHEELQEAPRLTAFVIEALADTAEVGDIDREWIDSAVRWHGIHDEFKESLPFGSGFAATATADLARAQDSNDPNLWRMAVVAWGDQRYYRAKAQWRLAQALIESDPSDAEASALLDSAQEVAQELGAHPLLDAIQETREKTAQ